MITLSSLSGVPLYRQIVQQVKQMAAAGTLKPGDRLPSVRKLAGELKVNALTVAKGYARLKAEGIVQSRPSKGIFIAGGSSPLAFSSRRKRLAASADEFVAEAYRLGIGAAEAMDLLGERFATHAAFPQSGGGASPGDGPEQPPADLASENREDVSVL
jgi:GntR family transcriptional regulator